MLSKFQPEEVLFIDIETVPQAPGFALLEEEMQSLWTEKSRYTRDRHNLGLEESYDEAGIYAEFGKVVCIGAGFFSRSFGERVFRVTSYYGDNEGDVLRDFAEMLVHCYQNPFRILCAHNGKEFDFPYLCRRFLVNGIKLPSMLDISGKKPWEIPHIDTMELWKFGDYKHYTSLKLLARIFGIPGPKDDIDGSDVRSVYYDENDLERIERYCRKDVVTVAQLFLRYKGENLLSDCQVIQI